MSAEQKDGRKRHASEALNGEDDASEDDHGSDVDMEHRTGASDSDKGDDGSKSEEDLGGHDDDEEEGDDGDDDDDDDEEDSDELE